MPTILIDKDLIIGHLQDVDLTDLPINCYESQKVRPVLIGYINRCRSFDNYAFCITNNYGVDDDVMSSAPIQVYIDKDEWVDKEDIKDQQWIIFELIKQPTRTRHKATQVRYLSPTLDDYNIAQNYVGEYSHIQGQIQGKGFAEKINVNIEEGIIKFFFSTEEGKQIILNDLYERKTEDIKEWEMYLSHLSAEEKRSFLFDVTQLKPTAELRLLLYSQLERIDWLLHPSVIAYLNTNIEYIESLFKHIKSEDDKQKIVAYMANSSVCHTGSRVLSLLSA